MTNRFKFTKAAIQKLPIPEKRTYYRDTITRHLLLDCHPSGTIVFQLYRKFNGSPKRISLGRFDPTLAESKELLDGTDPLLLLGNSPNLNVGMARALAEAVNVQLNRGVSVSDTKKEARKKQAGELTLGQAFDKYKNEYLIPNNKKTTQDLCDNFDRYLGNVIPGQKKVHGKEKTKPSCAVNWEKKKLSEIKSENIRKLLIDLKEGKGVATANRTFELLRTIFNKMIEWSEFTAPNPCLGISKFREESRDRFMQPDEIAVFFEYLDQHSNTNFRDYVLLSLFTGARKTNILSMNWRDIDLKRRAWSIPSEASKNGKVMQIPLVDIVIEILKKRQPLSKEWVFPADSKTGYMTSPKKHWANLIKTAGLSNLRPHDLRRTLASYAAISGESLLSIGKMLGHESSEATSIYARLNDNLVRATFNKASQAIIDNMEITKI